MKKKAVRAITGLLCAAVFSNVAGMRVYAMEKDGAGQEAQMQEKGETEEGGEETEDEGEERKKVDRSRKTVWRWLLAGIYFYCIGKRYITNLFCCRALAG